MGKLSDMVTAVRGEREKRSILREVQGGEGGCMKLNSETCHNKRWWPFTVSTVKWMGRTPGMQQVTKNTGPGNYLLTTPYVCTSLRLKILCCCYYRSFSGWLSNENLRNFHPPKVCACVDSHHNFGHNKPKTSLL